MSFEINAAVCPRAQDVRMDKQSLANSYDPNDIPDFFNWLSMMSPGMFMIPKEICVCAKGWIASRRAVFAWQRTHKFPLNYRKGAIGKRI